MGVGVWIEWWSHWKMNQIQRKGMIGFGCWVLVQEQRRERIELQDFVLLWVEVELRLWVGLEWQGILGV